MGHTPSIEWAVLSWLRRSKIAAHVERWANVQSYIGTLMRSAILPALLATSVSVLAKENLCVSDEIVYFSCKSKQKLVSLCGSPNIDMTHGYIQYRFGSKEKLEMAFPPKGLHPQDVFSRGFAIWSHGGYEATVDFSVGQYTYQIYSNLQLGSVDDMNNSTSSDSYGPHAGVRVYRAEKEAGEVRCTNDFTDPRDLQERIPSFLPVGTK